MGRQLDYWGEVAATAWRRTLASGLIGPGVAVTILGFGIRPLLGGGSYWDSVILAASFGVAFGVVALVLYSWNFLTTPARVYAEQLEAIAELEEALQLKKPGDPVLEVLGLFPGERQVLTQYSLAGTMGIPERAARVLLEDGERRGLFVWSDIGYVLTETGLSLWTERREAAGAALLAAIGSRDRDD